MNNLLQRSLTGLIGIPLAVFLIWAGGLWFAAAIIAITTLGLWEFYAMAQTKNAMPNVHIGIAVSISFQLMVTAASLSSFFDPVYYGMASAIVFVAGVVVIFTAEIWRARDSAILNTGLTLSALCYVTLGLSSLIYLRHMQTAPVVGPFATKGAGLILVLFVSVWACDTVAYFFGRWFGKKLLFKRISPKKTWEGALGGGVTAVTVFMSMSHFLMPSLPLIDTMVCGLIVGTMGQIGDLAESLLKRDAATKDSSQIIPGHGGVLDRFDSMLFASPLIFVYLESTSVIRHFLN